jgi:hypothetical protein
MKGTLYLVLLFYPACILAQRSPDARTDNYSYFHLNFVYSATYHDFSELDLQSFTIHSFSSPAHHLSCGHLRSGVWEADSEGHTCHESLTLGKTYVFTSSREAAKYMLVMFDEEGRCGSSNSTGYAQVWRLQNGRLSIVQQINFDTHFESDDWYSRFEESRLRLTVRASHYLDRDAHCCISAYDQLTFAWTGADFRLTQISTQLTEYGKSQGRKLPSQ